MTILKQMKECTKEEMYRMIMNKNNAGFKDMPDGESYAVENYIFYEKDDMNLLSVQTDKGIFSGNSGVFINTFLVMAEIFTDGFTFKKISGESKSKRTYIDCVLA